MVAERRRPAHPIRVLLLESNDLIRSAIQNALRRTVGPDGPVLASEPQEAFELASQHAPDLIIFDIQQEDRLWLDLPVRFRELVPNARLLLISDYDDPDALLDMLVRVDGYLKKTDLNAAKLVAAVQGIVVHRLFVVGEAARDILQPHFVLRLRPPAADFSLTEQEREILRLLSNGMNVKQVSAVLGISRSTLDRHLEALKDRAGAQTIPQLCVLAERMGLLSW